MWLADYLPWHWLPTPQLLPHKAKSPSSKAPSDAILLPAPFCLLKLQTLCHLRPSAHPGLSTWEVLHPGLRWLVSSQVRSPRCHLVRDATWTTLTRATPLPSKPLTWYPVYFPQYCIVSWLCFVYLWNCLLIIPQPTHVLEGKLLNVEALGLFVATVLFLKQYVLKVYNSDYHMVDDQ